MEDDQLNLKQLKIIIKGGKISQVNHDELQSESATSAKDLQEEDDELEEGEIREDEVPIKDNEREASKKKTCHHCGREFSSGKALGGHLRVHNESISRPEPSCSGLSPAQKQGEYPCSLCGKMFYSEKALHGHMRLHPERNYRGMQQPSKLGSGSASDQPVVSMAGPSRKVKFKVICNGDDGEGVGRENIAEKKDQDFNNNDNHNDSGGSKLTITKNEREYLDEDELYLRDYLGLKKNLDSNNNSHNINNTPWFEDVRRKKRTKRIIISNINNNDEENKWECVNCKETFPTQEDIDDHRWSCHNNEHISMSSEDQLPAETDDEKDSLLFAFDLNQLPEEDKVDLC